MAKPERRYCKNCGEDWVETGELACPFCGSSDTLIMDYDDEDEDDDEDYEDGPYADPEDEDEDEDDE